MDIGPRKLKSQEGEIFEIEESCLEMSKFLKDLVNDYPDADEAIMINQIKTQELKSIIEYLKHYEGKTPKEIPKPLPSGNLKEVLDEWDYNFINPLSLEKCIDLLNGAFFLDINALVNLASAKIASEMLVGTVEEVREKFEWKNMTEEDKKEYGLEDTDPDENDNEIENNKDNEKENENKIEDTKEGEKEKENKIEDSKDDEK